MSRSISGIYQGGRNENAHKLGKRGWKEYRFWKWKICFNSISATYYVIRVNCSTSINLTIFICTTKTITPTSEVRLNHIIYVKVPGRIDWTQWKVTESNTFTCSSGADNPGNCYDSASNCSVTISTSQSYTIQHMDKAFATCYGQRIALSNIGKQINQWWNFLIDNLLSKVNLCYLQMVAVLYEHLSSTNLYFEKALISYCTIKLLCFYCRLDDIQITSTLISTSETFFKWQEIYLAIF